MSNKRFGVIDGKPERYRCFQCGKVQGDYCCCEICGRDPFVIPTQRSNTAEDTRHD